MRTMRLRQIMQAGDVLGSDGGGLSAGGLFVAPAGLAARCGTEHAAFGAVF